MYDEGTNSYMGSPHLRVCSETLSIACTTKQETRARLALGTAVRDVSAPDGIACHHKMRMLVAGLGPCSCSLCHQQFIVHEWPLLAFDCCKAGALVQNCEDVSRQNQHFKMKLCKAAVSQTAHKMANFITMLSIIILLIGQLRNKL